MNRRNLLTTMGALPWLPGLLPASNTLQKSGRSLILIWLDGGLSHLDTFDCKPEAPPDIRGDLVAKESALEAVERRARAIAEAEVRAAAEAEVRAREEARLAAEEASQSTNSALQSR
ncbi:MAG: hypothetical protein AAF585_13260, partial [Verrucomicrobiota bacterium]